MSLKTKKILGINITINKRREILEYLGKYLNNFQFSISNFQLMKGKPLVIFTPNPEIITYAQKDQDFKKVVNSSQINIPDGTGVIWALQKTYGIKIEKITGVSLLENMIQYAAESGVNTGVIGGFRGLALDAVKCLRNSYRTLNITAIDAPEIELRIKNQESRMVEEKGKFLTSNFIIHDSFGKQVNTEKYFQDLVKKIVGQKISILFVGLGFPKQEYFINNLKFQISNFKLKNPLVLMSVGGSFDYISGRIPRAPRLMQNLGLEWLFRLMVEPWRLKRQLMGAEFFSKILLDS